jgi:hypothetical protein
MLKRPYADIITPNYGAIITFILARVIFPKGRRTSLSLLSE